MRHSVANEPFRFTLLTKINKIFGSLKKSGTFAKIIYYFKKTGYVCVKFRKI
jgi:hypothetical protein